MDPAKTDKPSQEAIIAMAKEWCGTPYHHQQSKKAVGCDCLGLVRGVYEEVYQTKIKNIPPYSRDWADISQTETLIDAAGKYLIAKEKEERRSSDVLIFRFRKWMIAKHAGIMVSPTTMIHAIEGAAVTEVHLGPWWQRHIAAVFAFPSIGHSK